MYNLLFKRWNQLDMAIVALSVLGIILEEIEVDIQTIKKISTHIIYIYSSFQGVVFPVNPTIIRVMRVLR